MSVLYRQRSRSLLPEDLRDIPHPIFGFVGALQSCIEYDYLEAAAKARPDWSFVLIGKEKPGVDLTALHAMPNVHFLGLKPNEQLPQYLAHFDACLNLFAKSDLSKDVSPLKFYEYLATGRPIVSTRQPDQILQYAPLIEIADSPEEFIAACEASLRGHGAGANRWPALRQAAPVRGIAVSRRCASILEGAGDFMKKKLLITGFDPFGGEQVNPAYRGRAAAAG